MAKNEYVCRFCVLLIILYANVNDSQLLTSCDNPLDNEVCELTCTTTNHNETVAFYKLQHSTTALIAQCIPTVTCGASGQYNISQPDLVSTVLSFVHSREKLGTWRCTYGSNDANVSVFWATFPQNVSTTLTSNTMIDTSMDVNATLECLYSDPDPTVTLQYEAASGKIVTSAETFQCVATADFCADVNFTTYACAVVIRAEAGIDYSYSYSIKLKTKVGNVQREDVKTIATGITFTSSGGTYTPTDNEVIVFVILCVCLLAAYCMVCAVCFCPRSTANKCGNCFLTFCQSIKRRLFDCCGRDSRLRKWLLGFLYLVVYGVIVGAIVLPPVYYAYSKYQEGLLSGVGFAIVLVLSGLCLLVVWMLKKKFFNKEKPKCEEQPDNSKIMMTEKDTT